jgi:hypothetical protein
MKIYGLILGLSISLFAQNQKMQIFKPVSSTCPQSWLDEMQQNVEDVKVVSLIDMKGLKHQAGVPKEIQSCNTSIIDDYIFEGNVPASAIKDFFKNIPKNATGLSLPAYENDKELKTVFIIFEDKTYKEFGKYH